MRYYYSDAIDSFLKKDSRLILGIITNNNQFDLNDLQRNSWNIEIDILKQSLSGLSGQIIFEYTIPRIGKRVDCVIIIGSIVFIIEFKVGESEFLKSDISQTLDYALDLKYFHEESRDVPLIPILVCTAASDRENALEFYEDHVAKVQHCNRANLRNVIDVALATFSERLDFISPDAWLESRYSPTPTIIEAAQALYAQHGVKDISRSDSGAHNLSTTTEAIKEIIEKSKNKRRKTIVFVTGVPGAGKTLAGINIANEMHDFDEDSHAVFLSGNQPLVSVLQEALARDDVERSGKTARIRDARRKTESFIQIIHHYRDEFVNNDKLPVEHVVIFDEAQRAWTLDQIASFMARKKGIVDFAYSEPEFLISTMDRHEDWAVIVCLVGGGQEINTGEAGLSEWFDSLRRSFAGWDVFVSDKLDDKEYLGLKTYSQMVDGVNVVADSTLHLATSIRSFRSENLSTLIKAILDNDLECAKKLFSSLERYPIELSRNIETAKRWVREHARGSERFGLIASSGGLRLKPDGIFVKNNIDAPKWFLNKPNDVRSSYYLEDVATEFDIQGLELDWAIVAWDLDLRVNNHSWSCHSFTGSRWNTMRSPEKINYLINSYRVLLTRARQGMVVYVPSGDSDDHTKPPERYDEIAEYLKSVGIPEVL